MKEKHFLPDPKSQFAANEACLSDMADGLNEACPQNQGSPCSFDTLQTWSI